MTTYELLNGGYKWVSRFETPLIRTRYWTGERWVKQVSRFHGTASGDSRIKKVGRGHRGAKEKKGSNINVYLAW